eukprot:1216952-Lingulodinium_polyedra.AAC.1
MCVNINAQSACNLVNHDGATTCRAAPLVDPNHGDTMSTVQIIAEWALDLAQSYARAYAYAYAYAFAYAYAYADERA